MVHVALEEEAEYDIDNEIFNGIYGGLMMVNDG